MSMDGIINDCKISLQKLAKHQYKTSVAVLAETSLSSPRIFFVFIIKKYIYL